MTEFDYRNLSDQELLAQAREDQFGSEEPLLTLHSWFRCEAFEARFDPNRVKALRLAAAICARFAVRTAQLDALRTAGDALAAAAEEAGLVPFALGVGAMSSGLALDPETKALADRQIADARAIADRLDAALADWDAARGGSGGEATPESEARP
jgi:hypothetical protein